MANQKDPVTDAVQDRYAEKVILSGSPFVSAILGPDAYRITAPSAPVFYTDPVISVIGGGILPLSTLICDEGSFNSSPRATLTYQWKKNTVNISNETSNTYTTVAGDTDEDITCEVTITNASGSDTGLSNILVMVDPLPLNVYTLDTMPIQGWSSTWRMDVNSVDGSVLSGLGADGRMEMLSQGALVATGMKAPGRVDVMSEDALIVTGLEAQDRLAIVTQDAHIITGLPQEDQAVIMDLEAYALFLPVPLTPLVVVNGDAENSNMSDWTMDSGNVTSVTSGLISSNGYREGLRFFKADDLGWGVDSQMSQTMVIDAGDLTDVDIGRCYCIVSLIHNNYKGYDGLVVTLDAIDSGSTILATKVFNVPVHPSTAYGWMRETSVEDPLNLPTLTRKIKITVLFVAHPSLGNVGNHAYADAITVELMKIE